MDQETLKRQLLETFKMELDEHILTLNKGLLRLEQGISGDAFDALMAELFRAAHSLKGASRTVDILDINLIAHRMEDVLGLIQHKKIKLSSHLFDLLFQSVDLIKEAMSIKLNGDALPFNQLNTIVEQLEAATVVQDKASVKPVTKKQCEIPKISPVKQNAIPLKQNAIPPAESEKKVMLTSLEETLNFLPDKKQLNRSRKVVDKKENDRSVVQLKENSITGSDDTIRVKTNKLDMLMACMGELMGSRMRTMQRMTELQSMQKQINRWHKEWRQLRGSVKSFERHHETTSEMDRFFDFMHQNADHLKKMHGDMNLLVRQFMNDCDQLSFVTDDLQDKIRNVRMQPISSLFDQFPRMIRDLSRSQNKNIRLEIFGEKTEVDRHVLDALKDPLTHLLRNAVDHGIEPPDIRERTGKQKQGVIQLKAAQKGSTIVIQVIDNGRGIDLESIRQQAVRQNIVPEQKAQALSERELTDLIFCSGLSTQTTITDISGRGVGLDVVRRNLEKLQGQILVESKPAKGTSITLTVSLSLATSQVLMVKVDGELLAIPCTTVERILKIHPKDIGQIEGKPAIVVNSEALPLYSLAQLLDFSDTVQAAGEEKKISVIVLIVAEKRLAFRVDELLETREIVIKNMGQQLRRVKNLSGATILGDGQVVMVLNVADLMKSAQQGAAYVRAIDVAPPLPERKHILVVDDSITTRTLEKNILENAGYRVLVCADGQEAWECIQSESFDAIVSDVDMPRMNGFQLTEHVRGDERYKKLPFILVTSLESRADKVRGMEVGADAYIVKGTFDQKELLETIERLIG
ncbi:MAG: hybrid sensor histidine kinase/response regulator [Candidatus Magnetomorum sp.]|nr:hybrid sensor histidine kinase/response regulator [Candidatus Magnetomorum sp.]